MCKLLSSSVQVFILLKFRICVHLRYENTEENVEVSHQTLELKG